MPQTMQEFAETNVYLSLLSLFSSRWFLVNVPYIRYIRNMTGVVNTGPSPPPILSVSDGGHIENLGLLSLLQLRLPKIVIANGSEIQSDAEYGTALLDSLQKGREKLKCSFTGLDGRDIIEDLRANFVDKSPGQQPRSYKYVSDIVHSHPLPPK